MIVKISKISKVSLYPDSYDGYCYIDCKIDKGQKYRNRVMQITCKMDNLNQKNNRIAINSISIPNREKESKKIELSISNILTDIGLTYQEDHVFRGNISRIFTNIKFMEYSEFEHFCKDFVDTLNEYINGE